MSARVCSECGESLAGKAPQTKTCGPTCRSARSRRLRAQQQEAAAARTRPEEVKIASEVVRGERDDVARRVAEEELRPVVREAITEDVLRGIQRLIQLTPDVVAKLEEDLHSDDATVRQRAYTLITKYTLGHPALVRPEDEEGGKELTVHFAMPRPEEPEPIDAPAVELEAGPTTVCDMCGDEKPDEEFVAGSSRCRSCYESAQEAAKKFMAEHNAD